MIRTFELEQVLKFKGHNLNNVSAYAYNLTQLVAGLELIQRRASAAEQRAIVQAIAAQATKAQVPIALAKIQATITTNAKLITVRQTHFDVDLSPCVASIWTPENSEWLKGYGADGVLFLKENATVEVALGVGAIAATTSEAPIFETIYCGSSQRLLQSGLMPDT
eukprot:gene26775-33746_t